MEIQQASLNASDRQLIAAWEALFKSPGWILIQRRYEKRLAATVSDLEDAETLLDLGYAKGNRAVLIELMALEDVLENEFNSVIADAQAEPLDTGPNEWEDR